MTNLQQLQKYFSEVLGVHEIMVKPNQLDQGLDSEKPSAARLIFLDEKSVRTAEGKDLLDKMIGAMKLDPSEYRILEITITEISENLDSFESAQNVVCFSKTLSNFILNNFPRVSLKSTFSPEDLLKKPEMKREVWELLKSLM